MGVCGYSKLFFLFTFLTFQYFFGGGGRIQSQPPEPDFWTSERHRLEPLFFKFSGRGWSWYSSIIVIVSFIPSACFFLFLEYAVTLNYSLYFLSFYHFKLFFDSCPSQFRCTHRRSTCHPSPRHPSPWPDSVTGWEGVFEGGVSRL